MKIGFIADTHGILKEEVLTNLQGCTYIFHAGDIGKPEILEALQTIGKVIKVRGNNDTELWAENIPTEVYYQIEGITFYMTHEKQHIPKTIKDVDCIIYGHSHKYEWEVVEGIQYINPGGCGRRRFSLPLTMAIGTIEEGKLTIKKISL